MIDGKTLAFALSDNLKKSFLNLTEKCTSVVCCRSTPIQKVRNREVYVSSVLQVHTHSEGTLQRSVRQ